MKIAIVGATGSVGRELIHILEERNFPVSSLQLFASSKSEGEVISFKDEHILVTELKDLDDVKADIAFFAVSSKISQKWAEAFSLKGIYCIDKSSAFREEDDVLLCVPEVNKNEINTMHNKIIASPNCVVAPLVQVLKPIHDLYGLKRICVSTYQAVSGAGREGVDELEEQVRDLFNLREPKPKVFKERIAFNVLPFILEEEEKLIKETKKILKLKDLPMEATCVRVPVFNGHSMSVSMETHKNVDLENLKKVLSSFSYLKVCEEPTPVSASGKDETFVGRIRKNNMFENGLSLFIASDNLRTGAALNAVKIAENLLKKDF